MVIDMTRWHWFLLACCMFGAARSSVAAEPASTVRVAGIVLKWVREDKEANFRRVEPMIREAAKNGTHIVCTTECFLDGYAIADKDIPLETYRGLGEKIPDGPYCQRLAGLAKELKIHLVAGMTEADGEARYNTAVLFSPDGKVAGKYHKQKLGHETVRNTPGEVSKVFETPFGKTGLMICADRTDPMIVRRFCDGGAGFLICPSGGMFGPKSNDPIVQARSKENAVHIVFVHPAEFLVTAPDGSILERAILGDNLLVSKEEVGGEKDRNRIFYVDLPVARADDKTPQRGYTSATASGAYVASGSMPSPLANQAATADENFVYAVDNAVVAKHDRATGKELARSTGKAEHLNSGFLWQGKLYCAHSNYPRKPHQSDIRVLDPETMKLEIYHVFDEPPGSLTWAVRRGEHWWCHFAHYGKDNDKSVLVQYGDGWKEVGRWTFPKHLVADWGGSSLSGGLWLGDDLLATGHDKKVIYRLRVPKAGKLVDVVEVVPSPFPGQGIAADPKTGGLVGIDRGKRLVLFANFKAR